MLTRRCALCHERIARSWLEPGVTRCHRAGCAMPVYATGATEPLVVPPKNRTTTAPPPKL